MVYKTSYENLNVGTSVSSDMPKKSLNKLSLLVLQLASHLVNLSVRDPWVLTILKCVLPGLYCDFFFAANVCLYVEFLIQAGA